MAEERIFKLCLHNAPDAQRWVVTDSVNGQLTATTHCHGDFETRAVTGLGMWKFHESKLK